MNKEEREKLKDQVMDMVVTGYTQRDIAHKLGLTLKTVNRYVVDRRKETIKEMRSEAEEQVAEMETATRKRIQRLWSTVLDKSVGIRDRNMALKLLQNEEVMNIKRKQLAGLLPRDDVNLNFNKFDINNADSIKIIFGEIELDDNEKIIETEKQAEEKKK